MANRSHLTKVKNFLSALRSTIFQIVGVMGGLGVVFDNGKNLLLSVAADWQEIKRSDDARALAGDLGAGIATAVTYLRIRWWLIPLVIGVVIVATYARMKLVVGPKQDAKSAYAKKLKGKLPEASKREGQRNDRSG